MGVGFNWFKSYLISEETIDYGLSNVIGYHIKYLDGGKTSHSYGNRTKLQNVFNMHCDAEIPNISTEVDVDLELIEPSKMSQMCKELLESDHDLLDMRDRIEWIKDLSDEGYYVSYDTE